MQIFLFNFTLFTLKSSWFHTVHENGDQNYHQQILWNNSSIGINNRVVFFWKNWYDKGIKYFGDILSENGSILSLTQFKEKFDSNVNFLNYFSLLHAIPQKWKRDVKIVDKEVNDNTFQEELILKLLKTKKVCKLVRGMLVQNLFKGLQLDTSSS